MRHWFGQSLTDWTFTVGGGGEAVLAGGVTITLWNLPSGGTQHTDLLDEAGAAVTTVTSADGAELPVGTIPRFQGPDGVAYMWADAGAGTRFLVSATDVGDIIPTAEGTAAQVSSHLAGDNPHSIPLGALIDVNAAEPADGQALVWDQATGRWIPVAIEGLADVVTLATEQTITAPKTLQPSHGDVVTTPLRIRFSGDRNEAASILLAEWNAGTEGAPSWRRTAELNEYGMLRLTSPVAPQTMLRLRADPAQTAPAMQVTDLTNTARMWIEIDGRVRAPNMSVVPPHAVKGTVATGTGGHRWYNDTGQPLTIRSVRASVGTAPTGADLIVDVNVSGSTIWSTQANRPAIPAGTNTSGAVTAINTTTIPAGGFVTVDVDAVGSTVPGADLTVQILAY